jgi:IstB-like ATP binding protein
MSASPRRCSQPRSPPASPMAGKARIKAARFPARKTPEEFDWTAQPAAERPLLMHLAQLAWIEEHANVCLVGPPDAGKTHVAIAISMTACPAGHRVAFATATEWVARQGRAQAPAPPPAARRRPPRLLRAARQAPPATAHGLGRRNSSPPSSASRRSLPRRLSAGDVLTEDKLDPPRSRLPTIGDERPQSRETRPRSP